MKKYYFNKGAELIPLTPIGFNFCYSPVVFNKGEVISGIKRGTVVFFSKNNKNFAVDDSLGILLNMNEVKSNAVGRMGGGAMRGAMRMPMNRPMMNRPMPIPNQQRPIGRLPIGLARRGFPSRRHYRNGKFYVPYGFSVYNTLGGMCYYLDENGFPVYFPCNSWVYDLDVTNIP